MESQETEEVDLVDGAVDISHVTTALGHLNQHVRVEKVSRAKLGYHLMCGEC